MIILIAEDQPAIAESFRVFLESEGHEVVLTYDGEACLQMYNRAITSRPRFARISNDNKWASAKDNVQPPFNVVVLDVRMPKIDGVDVAKEIMSMCPDQKIVMSTAYGEETAPKMLIEQLGKSVDILQKPFDLENFAAMINDLN